MIEETGMMSGLSGYNKLMPQIAAGLPAGSQARSQKAGKEFLTVFYKEMLKQVIKTPNFSMVDDEKGEGNTFSSLNSEIMIEKLAEKLAESQATGNDWLPAEGKVK